MTHTRGITFSSDAQRKAYIADCRADALREAYVGSPLDLLGHDRTLVGQTFYLAPALKDYRLSKDGSCVTDRSIL